MKTKCMSCGGSMKTMQKGGPIKKKLLASDSNNAKYLFDKNGNKTTKEQYFNTLKTLGKKPMKKMELGGTTTKRIIKKSTGGMYGIPQENLGTSGQYGFAKKGGATKFAALAPPYNKATFADRIAGAKKKK